MQKEIHLIGTCHFNSEISLVKILKKLAPNVIFLESEDLTTSSKDVIDAVIDIIKPSTSSFKEFIHRIASEIYKNTGYEHCAVRK